MWKVTWGWRVLDGFSSSRDGISVCHLPQPGNSTPSSSPHWFPQVVFHPQPRKPSWRDASWIASGIWQGRQGRAGSSSQRVWVHQLWLSLYRIAFGSRRAPVRVPSSFNAMIQDDEEGDDRLRMIRRVDAAWIVPLGLFHCEKIIDQKSRHDAGRWFIQDRYNLL